MSNVAPTLEEINDITTSWAQAVQSVPDTDPNTKALLGGVNFRLNVAQGFKAVWKATKLYIRVKAAGATGGTLVDFVGIGADVVGIVIAGLDMVRQKLPPTTYVGSYVLAQAMTPLTPEEFKKAIEDFVTQCGTDPLPFYTGLGNSVIQNTKNDMGRPAWFTDLVTAMTEEELLVETKGRYEYQSKNFTWGLK